MKRVKKQVSNEYEIYTDGGYSMQNNKGGFAYIVLQNGKEIKREAFPIINETNNRAELKAMLYAIKNIPPNSLVRWYSDSQYALGILAGTWKATKNTDIVGEFKSYVKKNIIAVNPTWVKGHNGNKWNEECDKMCNEVAGVDLNEEYEVFTKPTKPTIKSNKMELHKMTNPQLQELFGELVREMINRYMI